MKMYYKAILLDCEMVINYTLEPQYIHSSTVKSLMTRKMTVKVLSNFYLLSDYIKNYLIVPCFVIKIFKNKVGITKWDYKTGTYLYYKYMRKIYFLGHQPWIFYLSFCSVKAISMQGYAYCHICKTSKRYNFNRRLTSWLFKC